MVREKDFGIRKRLCAGGSRSDVCPFRIFYIYIHAIKMTLVHSQMLRSKVSYKIDSSMNIC